MAITHQLRRLASVALIGGGMAFAAISTPIVLGALTPAAAQISEDAQVALEQYGSWRPHPRFGEVWVPTGVPPDWRPYAYGHWVYTDEWGWYWVSDDVEADWGWVVYHYGRWAFERGFGWYWVPGDEWAPAWVDWRYGDDYSGWAPLPPDELIGTYEVEPTYWVFVPTRYMAAPRLRTYYVPVQRRSVILRSTHIVNRTFAVRGSRLAVNPGISPAFVARVSGAPVSTYRVRPRVFASTQGVAGAVQVRREDLRGARGGRPGGPAVPAGPGARTRLGTVSVERTTAVITAKRCGHCSAATREKRARPIGNTSTARRTRRRPDAVGCARARAAAVTASAAKCRRANATTGLGLRSGPPPATAPTTTAPATTPIRQLRQEGMHRPSGWSGARNVAICVHQVVQVAERRRLDNRLRRRSRISCGQFRHRHRRLHHHLRRKNGGCSRHRHRHPRRNSGRCSRHRRPRCVRRRHHRRHRGKSAAAATTTGCTRARATAAGGSAPAPPPRSRRRSRARSRRGAAEVARFSQHKRNGRPYGRPLCIWCPPPAPFSAPARS